MRPNFFQHIWKSFITTSVLLFFFFTGYGQTKEKMSLSYGLDSIKNGSAYIYNLHVMATGGNEPFTFYLCDEEPWFGGKILEEHENVITRDYTFSISYPPDKLLILVKGSGKNEHCFKFLSTKPQ
jgi:hypothetical protein